jgi:hypothetical protein
VLESSEILPNIQAMGFVKALIVWLIMAAVIGTGLVMAVKGSLWLLLLSLAAFIVMVAKIGCSVSDH